MAARNTRNASERTRNTDGTRSELCTEHVPWLFRGTLTEHSTERCGSEGESMVVIDQPKGSGVDLALHFVSESIVCELDAHVSNSLLVIPH